MKKITKGPVPAALRAWREANEAILENLTYGRGGWPSTSVRQSMLEEQGYLCAYTMQRIASTADCHTEHIVPQSQPNQPPYLDIDYSNLLACFPTREEHATRFLNTKIGNCGTSRRALVRKNTAFLVVTRSKNR